MRPSAPTSPSATLTYGRNATDWGQLCLAEQAKTYERANLDDQYGWHPGPAVGMVRQKRLENGKAPPPSPALPGGCRIGRPGDSVLWRFR